jgi:hypothetical protein
VGGFPRRLASSYRSAPSQTTCTRVCCRAARTFGIPPTQHGRGSDFTRLQRVRVRIFDAQRGRHLVAAIEIVSPANKDRPEHRNVFVGKCAALLQKGVAGSIVDVVTVRHFNLYADLPAFVGHDDPTLGVPPPDVYAASCRWIEKEKRTFLQVWSHALSIGQPLPRLPLWLSADLVVPLDLEQSYQQTCHDFWIA